MNAVNKGKEKRQNPEVVTHETLSPVAHLSDESTYAKLIEQPKLGPLHSTPRYEGQNDRTAYRVEGHEARDRIYGPPNQLHKRRSHRSHYHVNKLDSISELGSPSNREISGSSGGMIELAAANDNTRVGELGNKHYVEVVEILEHYDESDDDSSVNSEHEQDDCVEQNSGNHQGMWVEPPAQASSNQPRKDDGRVPAQGQSQLLNDGQNAGDSSGDALSNHQDSGSTAHYTSCDRTASSGHQASSDVNMAASSDHHSGSASESLETAANPLPSHNEFLHQNQRSTSRVKQSHSSNSIKSYNNFQQPYQPYPHHSSQPAFIHPYQPAAKVVPHPDVYNNNNTANGIYSDNSRPFHGALPSSTLLNNQKPMTSKLKRAERPKSVDLWKNSPNELHKFEEEQLNRKYGVNGEFEVMGVL
ncbi:hypothetical protein Btru_008214 [Bulinus truncatus]|nr:hypothetical protein Btru_008214 [Bulinus truncatus]